MNSIQQFERNAQHVRDMHGLYININNFTTSALDISDILRAEIVLIISAFDYYIHHVIREGILETFLKTRPESNSFKNIQLKMSSVQAALANPSSSDWLLSDIYIQHSWKTFQSPSNVSDALKFITDKRVWEEVSKKLGKPADQIKKQLELLVQRRNKIAHEADIDPGLLTSKTSISEATAREAIEFIENLVNAIAEVVKI